MSSLRVNRIQRCCFHDGPGIRTTVFLQGCPLRCWWCHNPEARSADGGESRTVADLADEVLRDRRFWQHSGGGVTLSGGEPLRQAEGVTALLARLGREGVHRAIETAAVAAPAVIARLLPLVELWLVDLKHGDAAVLRRETGAALARVLDSIAMLQDAGAELRLRVPVIAGFNDTPAAWRAHAIALRRLPRPAPVELLPGHDWAKAGGARRSCAVEAGVLEGFADHLRDSGIELWERPCIP